MSVSKHGAFILLCLIISILKLQGEDFRIIMPGPDISGVTKVNIADLNNDRQPDIEAFESGKHAKERHLFAWYRAPDWVRHEFNPDFSPGPFSGDSEFADLNGDGKKDLLVKLAEGAEVYLAWYDNPKNPRTQPWARHVIEDHFTANHQAVAFDFDMDGDIDVFVELSSGKKGMYLWLNDGNGTSWTKEIIDTVYGMYYGVAGDLGNDGVMDIVGPNTYSRERNIFTLENKASPGARNRFDGSMKATWRTPNE